ncbi:MAG: hypothetical protein D6737_17210 [Chloroflexi bacterium]|nr:MAG: hypothetical protein D6737_17210 [Chloroflexota bacterium]
MFWGHDVSFMWGGGGFVMMFIFWAIIIGGGYGLLKILFGQQAQETTPPIKRKRGLPSDQLRLPEEIARERYARGEISRDEYLDIMGDLQDDFTDRDVYYTD